MTAPYPIKGVANAFLKRSFDEEKPISPMKLQKLVFLAHGYYLAATGNSLIAEGFQAWQYGPVSMKLYREFKRFGGSPITSDATEVECNTSDDFGDADFINVAVPPADREADVRKVIDFVWARYKEWSARELSDLTHKKEWAWDRVTREHRGERHVEIPDAFIASDFRTLIKKKNPSEV